MIRAWFKILIVSMLLIGQYFSILHAAEFGADHHQHDSVSCSVVLPEDEYEIVFTENVSELEINWLLSVSYTPAPPQSPSFFHSFLPPSTGPPVRP